MIFFAHEQNPLNPGDASCSPYAYLDFGSTNSKILSVLDLEKERVSPSDTVILGGGGMLNDMYLPILESLVQKNKKTIFWGIGTNRHFWPGLSQNFLKRSISRYRVLLQERLRFLVCRSIYTQKENSILQKSAKAGMRDFQSSFEILPCSSCLHPIFDEFPVSKIVDNEMTGIFGHSDFLKIKEFNRSKNFEYIGKDIVSVVRSIASCSSIVTSSYHCAYWAMLLGKKVSIRSFSTKHLHLKPLLHLAKAKGHSFLDWARKKNLEFRNETEQFL